MAKFIAVGLGLLLFAATARAQDDPVEDISDDHWIFRSTALPADEKTYATIGNGHVATVMHRDSVFMNGVYNGLRGYSHRARIPSRNNIVVLPAAGMPDATEHTYELNVMQGIYTESFVSGSYSVKVRTFADRYHHTVMYTQIAVEKSGTSPDPLQLQLIDLRGDTSQDIAFGDAELIGAVGDVFGGLIQCGETLEVEDSVYQKDGQKYARSGVCVATRSFDTQIEFSESGTMTLFTSYARTKEVALNEYEAVSAILKTQNGDATILSTHTASWMKLWADARIEVTDNLLVAKVVNGAMYYLLASLPITTPTLNPVGQFYGLSPGSLSFGGHNFDMVDINQRPMDYQGHSFWDTETWMYPPILMFHPDKAQQLLNYRMNGIRAARDRAIRTGYRGARFPWESGFTGREVTPDCCEETRDLQIHVSADIMFAFRQYVALTRDINWLTDKKAEYLTNPCGLIREVADYFASRTCYNPNGFYDIKGVMPPDEDNYNNVVNNGFTNVDAGYAIFFAKYAECLCGDNMESIPDEWVNIARNLAFLYNETDDYHPEYEGFDVKSEPKRTIKQADVVLLGYPLMYDMKESTRRNDLELYEAITREDGPAMTWAMHTIGWLDLDDAPRADGMFERSYSRYMRQPFKTWTEAIYPNNGAHNFITGMGGFLQSIINGYGGIRLYPEELVFRKPHLIPGSSQLKLIGLNYLQSRFDYSVAKSGTTTEGTLTLTQEGTFPLFVVYDGANIRLEKDKPVTVNFDQITTFTISTDKDTGCPVPIDVIGGGGGSKSSAAVNGGAFGLLAFLLIIVNNIAKLI